jgi:uncharacterized OB-fold protein
MAQSVSDRGLAPPQADADSAYYWAQAAQGKLVLRQCCDCGQRHFPPRFACPSCWSQHLDWIQASGDGSVYTFTVVRRAPDAQWQARVPYVVALIDLAEGPRMMANIVGEHAAAVAVGEAVELCFERRGEGRLPQFRRLASR